MADTAWGVGGRHIDRGAVAFQRSRTASRRLWLLLATA
jgi:hypothetical protein